MSDLIHIISWERFCQKDNLNDLDKYAQFPMQRYPGLLDIRNLNIKQTGPPLHELPENCLPVLMEKSRLLLEYRQDGDAISGVDVIFKLLCLMARNNKNVDKLNEYGAINIVVRYMDLTMNKLSKDIDMEWLNLFEYLLYFLEIIYDPTFSWRRRKKLYFAETKYTEDYYSSPIKVLPVGNEIITWLCSHLSNYSHERDILNRLLHLLCSILSGSKLNAQLLISPAVVDTFTFQSDINAEIMTSYCFLTTCLSKIPTQERQEDMSMVVSKWLRFLTEKPELRIHEIRCLSQMCDVNRELCACLITCDVLGVLDRCLSDAQDDKQLRQCMFTILSKLTAGSWEVRQQFLVSDGYQRMLDILMKYVSQSSSLLDMVFSWAVCGDFDASKVSVSTYVIRDGHVVSLLVKWGTMLAILLDEGSSSTCESAAKKEILHWKAIFKLLMEMCGKSRSSLSECCESGVISVLCACIRQACRRLDDSVPAVMDYDDEDMCKRVADSRRICDDLFNGLFHLLEMFSAYSVSGTDLASIIQLFRDRHSRTRGRRIVKMFNNIVSEGNLHEDIDCWLEFFGPEDCIQILPAKESIYFTLGLNNSNFGEAVSTKVQETLDGKINPNGFSFHCWLNLTPKSVVEKVNSGHERSCIFRILTENFNGFEAFLNMDGQLLVATCHQGEFHYVQVTSKTSGRRSSFFIEENLLKCNKWHMLDLVFQNTRGFLRRSTVSVYVDGLLINTLDLKYPMMNEKISVFHIAGCPKSISKELVSSLDSKFRRKSAFLSNNSIKRTWFGEEHNVWGRLSTLKCRITSVACINDIITDQVIGNLFIKGHTSSQAILGDETLCNNVFVNYHSLAFDHLDNRCRNLHPYILSSRCGPYLSGHLTGQRLSCLKLETAINEIGGVSALLPIIEQLDFMELSTSDVDIDSEDGYRFKENSPNKFIGRMVASNSTEDRFISVPDRKSDEQLDESILASIVILFRKLSLLGVNQQLMERSKCIEIISGFLQKIETIFLDMNVVIAFHSLADQCGPSLSAKIYQLILLDWRIWSRCNQDTRLRHAVFVSNLVKHELSMFRNQYGVGFFLDIVQFYHRPCVTDGTEDSDWTIRQQLYDVIFNLIHRHATAQDYRRVIKFIHQCNNDTLIEESLTLLTRLFETENNDLDRILFYESKMMETLLVLLVRDVSVSTKEETIKFLNLLVTSHRVADKHKDYLLLTKVSFSSIFIYRQFYDSALSSRSIHYLLDILRKSATKDLFGTVQFLSLLTMSPIEQRTSALKMLQSIFDKSPDAIFLISEQPGWQDILIHLLVSQKRDKQDTKRQNKEEIKTGEVIMRTKDVNSNDTGFRRCSTWAFDESICDTSTSIQSKIDEILEEDHHLMEGNCSVDEQETNDAMTVFLCDKEDPVVDSIVRPTDLQRSLCDSVSGSEDMLPMLRPTESLTNIHARGHQEWALCDADTEELIELVLQTLHKVIWSVLSPGNGEQVWMIVHQVLESLRSVNERYIMLKSVTYFKQRILIGLLNSTISYWKSIDSFSQYKVMHATELIRLIVDSSCQIGLDHHDIELLDLTVILLQDCLQVWDEISQYPELTGLGFHYLLSLSHSDDMDIVSVVCARLHQIITTISKNISYEEIAFILVYLDRVLTTAIHNENYYFIAPILKTLLEQHEDVLQVSTYLPSLAIRTPDFYDYFKEYCGQTEWKTFIKSRLHSACEIYESSYLNRMTTGQSLWRAEANERMSVDRKKRVAITVEHKKLFEGEIMQLTQTWIKDEQRRKDHKMVELQNQHETVLKQWRIVRQSLTSSKGCWHDEESTVSVRLKQSYRENYLRMRPRFEINYQFDDHLDASNERDHPRRSLKEPEPDPLKCLSVLEGKIDFSALGDDQLGDDEWISIQNITELVDANHNTTTNSPKQSTGGARKCVYECRCKLISLTDVIDGRFELSATHFIFQGNTQSADSLDSNNSKIMCSIVQIREVHLRRYNLRRSAIEIFLTDQTNYFFNFDATTRDRVYSKILSLRPPNLVYSKQRSPAEMLKCSGLTQRWVNREISNFEYLMQLNTIAGRTYNDLSQYPVFPWIIADYVSEKLDLDNPNTFRDLSKPIGVVNPKNENEVREKYEGFEDPSGVIAKFHYGTHYSSAAGVMHYLVRMEPFTSLHIQLQGGKFDVADRQFHSIPLSWRFIMECPSDNKELIPEFFYQPQFLRNTNAFDFGKLQLTKTSIDDVELPTWAKSPEDFIFQHRQALESEHVSMNLHNWIDLIFGYKQKGLDAVKALNVFYYVTYEGVVDLDQIADPYERESIESMINNFGQTPCQLLKSAHPRRMTAEEVRCQMMKIDKFLPVVSHIQSLKHTSRSVCRASEPIVFVRVPLAQGRTLIGPDRSLSMITIHSSNIVARHSWTTNSKSIGPGYHMEVDPVFDSPNMRRRNYLGLLDSSVKSTNQLYALTPDGRYILAGGNIENRLTIMPLSKKSEAYYSTTPHHRPISCVAIDIDAVCLAAPGFSGVVGGTLCGITGSLDSTCVLWDWSDLLSISVSHVLCGHNGPVTSVSMSVYLDVAVSASEDGTVNLHSVSKGQFLHTIRPGTHVTSPPPPVNQVVVTRMGHIYIQWQNQCHITDVPTQVPQWLSLYSLHGHHISTGDLGTSPVTVVQVLAKGPGSLDSCVLVGNLKGHLAVRDGHDLATELSLLRFTDPILDVNVLTPGGQYLAVALSNGQLIISSGSWHDLDPTQ